MSAPERIFVTDRPVRRCRHPDDLELFFLFGVVNENIEHEPVELGFRQRIGSFLLDRILRRQHEERVGQPVPFTADGDLPFLHRFEKGSLRLGRGPVDLVGEHDIGENRAPEELELADARRLVFLDDFGPGDVGGHQVGSELDSVVRQIQRIGERVDHQSLGEARHADQEAVSAREDRDQQLLDNRLLADDDLAKLILQLGKCRIEPFDGGQVVFLERFRLGRSSFVTHGEDSSTDRPLVARDHATQESFNQF